MGIHVDISISHGGERTGGEIGAAQPKALWLPYFLKRTSSLYNDVSCEWLWERTNNRIAVRYCRGGKLTSGPG